MSKRSVNVGRTHKIMNTNIIRPKTASRYEKVSRQLRARYTRETGLEPESDCTAFQDWMKALYATVMPASRRQYQASLAHYQGKHHPDCMPDPIPKDLHDKKAIQAEYGKRGPADKAKGFPPHVGSAVLDALQNAANKSRGKITRSVWASHLFRAILRFGLRPIEWRGSRFIYLEDGELALEVPNAKYSQGRAFGPTRTLIVDEKLLRKIDPLALESAVWLTENAHPLDEGTYEKIIKGVKDQMKIILKRCGTPCRLSRREIALYSARHQFSSNAKDDGYTREEVAAMMGHASIYTAGEHYGKRRRGHGSVGARGQVSAETRQTVVSPHIDNLRKVEALEQERQARREQRERRKKPKSGPGMG